MEEIITKTIQKGLKSRIKASICVAIGDGGVLNVSVKAFGYTWTYKDDKIYDIVLRGELQSLINKIVNSYRGYILNCYFVNDKEIKKKEEKRCNA